jgi:transglutaminase-like putative cysteine protease
MNLPRFLIGAALLLWGWQTGMTWMAVLMALTLETANFVRTRWEFSDSDLNRIYDLCTVLFVGAAIYCVISRNTTNDVMTFLRASSYTARGQAASQAFNTTFVFFQWWPMIFCPIALAQAYGSRARMPYSTFSWYLRRRAARGEPSKGGLNIGFIYFAIVLVATSVTGRRELIFYFGFCLVAAWALWVVRPRRFSNIIWICVMIVIIKGGFWGHRGLNVLQGKLENSFADLAQRFAKKNPSRQESSTAIGQIGEVKGSGAIVLRVEPEGNQVPQLLRVTSYNLFRTPTWYTSVKDFGTNIVTEGESAWRLLPRKRTEAAVNVSMYMSQGFAYLALPNGTADIINLPVTEVHTNLFGLVKAVSGPSLLDYRARYGPGPTFDSPPSDADRAIPGIETNAISIISDQLDLKSKSEPERVAAIEKFFQKHFEYSTYLSIKAPGPRGRTNSALSEFLLTKRTGHCEYFATATVLLLRHAGTPARYATGYSIQEKEKNSTRYLARDRHAHAWCLYYSAADKAWHDFDTTPASWLAIENQQASSWEAWTDFWSNVWYKFSRWRWLGERIATEKYLALILVALVAYLLWRLFYGKQRTRRAAKAGAAARDPAAAGFDSEFYLAEKRLADLGFHRLPGETLTDWLRRVDAASPVALAPLRPALRLHYQYRFDPAGLTPADRATLRTLVQDWLREAAAAKTPAS